MCAECVGVIFLGRLPPHNVWVSFFWAHCLQFARKHVFNRLLSVRLTLVSNYLCTASAQNVHIFACANFVQIFARTLCHAGRCTCPWRNEWSKLPLHVQTFSVRRTQEGLWVGFEIDATPACTRWHAGWFFSAVESCSRKCSSKYTYRSARIRCANAGPDSTGCHARRRPRRTGWGVLRMCRKCAYRFARPCRADAICTALSALMYTWCVHVWTFILDVYISAHDVYMICISVHKVYILCILVYMMCT
jgi:hypothetical protein